MAVEDEVEGSSAAVAGKLTVTVDEGFPGLFIETKTDDSKAYLPPLEDMDIRYCKSVTTIFLFLQQ